MSQIPGARSDAGPRRGLPPWAILVCGALATGLCLLLLFGPFYVGAGSPGEMVRYRLTMLLDGRGPHFLHDLLWRRFVLSSAVVLGVILMLLPWRGARKRRRSGAGGATGGHRAAAESRSHAGSARTSVTVRTTSLTFSDDGRVVDPEDPGAEMIERSVSDLRAMARAARIPWHSDYETSGGARAFLEVLRALGTGPVDVHRAEDVKDGASGQMVGEDSSDTLDAPDISEASGTSGTQEASDTSGTQEASDTSGTFDTSDTAAPSAGTADRLSAYGPPSSTGSVYTPTTLYSSPMWDRGADEDRDEEEQR